jgi:hypothetical protein
MIQEQTLRNGCCVTSREARSEARTFGSSNHDDGCNAEGKDGDFDVLASIVKLIEVGDCGVGGVLGVDSAASGHAISFH